MDKRLWPLSTGQVGADQNRSSRPMESLLKSPMLLTELNVAVSVRFGCVARPSRINTSSELRAGHDVDIKTVTIQ